MDCGYAIYKVASSDEPACVELTNKIKGSMYNVAKEFVYIGFLLAECDYYETYKEWGFSSIHEYASDQLGFKKSSTYNFINVCKAFCNPTEALPFSYFMKDPYTNFNYSQLVEMLSMNDKQRSEVTPDMSVKQIREVKKSFHEPEYTKLYYMQLNFQEFSEVYHRKINGKKFQLTVSGRKCEPSDIFSDGYNVSFYSEILNDCGHCCGYNRIVDYKEFVDLVLSFWNAYIQSDDSRRLESVQEEAPAPDVPEEAPAPDVPEEASALEIPAELEPEVFSYPGYDLIIPLRSDLHALFNSIEEAYLDIDKNIGSDLFDMVFGYLKSNDYIICKKVNKKPKNRFALK